MAIQTFAQQRADSNVPAWMNGDMPPKSNQTYEFRKVTGEGRSLAEARHDATMTILGDLMREKGVTVSSTQREKILVNNNESNYSETTLHDYDYTFEFESHKFSFKAVDDYWEQQGGSYHCTMLYEVAVNPDQVHYESVEYTTNYGTSAVLRSLIVPGWGQMYKRQTVKGIIILGSTIAGAAGIVVSQNQYTSYRNKANKEVDTELRNSYQNKSTSWGNIRNGFIVGTAAVYAYNIIDVLVSKGAKRYKKRDMAIAPFVSMDDSYGVSLAINF